MPKKTQSGFTLIEILVTIVILVLISILAIPNFRRFNQEEVLKNATQSLLQSLRQAQTNSQSRVQCSNNSSSVDWSFTFTSPSHYSFTPNCEVVQNPAPMPSSGFLSSDSSIHIDRVDTNDSSCLALTPANLSINFVNKANQIQFSYPVGSPNSCVSNPSVNSIYLVIIDKQNLTKQISIDKGGGINER